MTLLTSRDVKQTIVPVPIMGMNTKDPPHLLPEGMGVDLYNVEIDEVIGVNKRNGFAPFNTNSYLMPRYNAGTIKEITGAMVYGSGVSWTASVCKQSDILMVLGNSSPVFLLIATCVGTATMSLAVAYTQTVTAGTYVIGPKEVDSLYNFKYGTTQRLVVFAGSNGFYATPGVTGSFTAIDAGLTDYANVSATIFQDVLYFCNGYEFKTYTGSAVAAVGGTPDPDDPLYVDVYTVGNANYIWIGGSLTAADYSQFAFSDVNAGATWPSANIYYAGDRDGQKLTGGKPIPGGFAIFKERSIYVFSGIPGSGYLRKVISDVGCLAPRTLVAHEGLVYFVGKRGGQLGLFRFNGSSVEQLSVAIDPTLTALAQGSISNFQGEIKEDKYILSARTSAGTDQDTHFTCYIYRAFNHNNRTYYPWVRGSRSMNCLKAMSVSGTEYLYSGATTSGTVNIEDTGTSDDTTDNLSGIPAAINAYAESSWLNFGDFSKNKELLNASLNVTQSGDWNLKFYLYRDFQTYGYDSYSVNLSNDALTWAEVIYGVTVWQTATDKAIEDITFNYPNIAKHFKFRWVNSNAAQGFTAYPITVEYKTENR